MKIEWAMLANSAEVREGLLYTLGATWDTVYPLVDAPPDAPYAVVNGALVVRALLNRTETGREHTMGVELIDADGTSIAGMELGFMVQLNPLLPAGWEQGAVIPVSITGLPIPAPGQYEFAITINGHHQHSVHLQARGRA